MSSPVVVVLLRLLHILGGVFWVGSVLFLARFLLPTSAALGPAAGPVMDHVMRVKKAPAVLLGTAAVVILSGLGLYWHDSLGFTSAWMRSPTGMVFGSGAALALIAFLVGIIVNKPTADRLGQLAGTIKAGGAPPTPEQTATMQALQARLGAALRAVAILLVLATAAMAMARYVG